jgi:fructose-1,6-bisphosphatase/inositol monophosphatase family enzyme
MSFEKEALQFMEQTSRQAGQIARRHFRAKSLEVGDKAVEGSTVVTNADVEVSYFIEDAVATQRVGEGVLSEEKHKRLQALQAPNGRWVIDPIDGTWLYAKGALNSMLLAALVRPDGVPVAGVAYNFMADDMFTAYTGGGAFLNGQPIRVSQYGEIAGGCFSIPGNVVPAFDTVGLFGELVGRNCDIVISGSAGYDAVQVALGFAAGYVHPYSSPWDIAVIKLLVEEAGGKVTSLRGREQRYDDEIDGALVTNGLVHDELLKVVSRRLTRA